jgi:restriction system protein
VSQLQSFDRDTSLVIFDGVDDHPLDDGMTINKVLSGMPRTTVFMTARTEKLHPSWQEILSRGPDPTLMPLQGLDARESRELLLAAGATGPDVQDVVQVAGGVPRLLHEWARWNVMPEAALGEGPPTLATILGPDGRPLEPGSEGLNKAELSVRGVNDALVQQLAARPELMYELSPRKFEELMAELYDRAGYEVELTRASGDGGVDLYALQRAPFGSFLAVVDCKRHRANRPVGVGLIRQMRGTVEATDASVGVIATTSYFTKGAKEFQRDDKHRLGLQDFVSICEMLQDGQR